MKYLAVALALSRAKLILIATVLLGVSVISTVLLARVVAVQIHLVHNVSLKHLLQLCIGFVLKTKR